VHHEHRAQKIRTSCNDYASTTSTRSYTQLYRTLVAPGWILAIISSFVIK
jgi:hypothetical protein